MPNIDYSYYTHGGRPVTSTHLLLLLGEMEGVYQHLKYMGFDDDMNIINDMKQCYYKLYFKKVLKEEKAMYEPKLNDRVRFDDH